MCHDDVNIERRLSALGLNIEFVIVVVIDEFPHLQFFVGVLSLEPSFETAEVGLRHYVSLIPLNESHVISDGDNQKVPSSELKVFVIVHVREQFLKASIVVNYS